MKTELESALRYHPIREAERLTGRDYKEDESVVWLGMALMHEQKVKTDALLFLNHDTNSWTQTLEEWLATVEEMGFERIICEDIPGTGDKFMVYWRSGVLLRLDTFWNGKSVNGAYAYFNFCGPRDAMFKCSNGFAGEIDGKDVWEGSVDARLGLRFALGKMSESGELLHAWIKQPFMWLLHYQDTKTEGYDYKAINAERIAKLPAHIQDAIRGE